MDEVKEQTRDQMFRIRWDGKIESVEVVKRTKRFVTIIWKGWGGIPSNVRVSTDKLHPSWEAARNYLIKQYEGKITYTQGELARLQSRLFQIRNMKP